VDLGASPRATICWGRLVKVWALLMHRRAEVFPEDIQDLARYVLSHRVWLGPHAASHGVSVEMVITTSSPTCRCLEWRDQPPQEIAEIELPFILKRMKEFTLGDHASVFKGSGFNFVGIRDWQPGDRLSNIDWAQSSLNNFSPPITREFEQDSNAAIVAVADASLSTRCGIEADLIATSIARAVAAAGLSAMFFQDRFGVVTFNDRFEQVAAARPRIGRSHLLYCLDLYRQSVLGKDDENERDVIVGIQARSATRRSFRSSPDFLFPDVQHILTELSKLNAANDVFLVMADARFAYDVPKLSDGWIDAFDIETGRYACFPGGKSAGWPSANAWQDEVVRIAKDADLDVVRVGLDRWEMETALVEFTAERRLRKM
jgi:hypothetical protein